MQKTLIALQATKDRGKTQTIGIAYKRLLQQGAEIVRQPLRTRSTDVRQAILEINGVQVGFASSGDTAKRLEEDLAPLLVGECSVIVCATHTSRSETVMVVERLALEHGYKIVPIKKERAALVDAERANQEMADEIIGQVQKAIEQAQLVEV